MRKAPRVVRGCEAATCSLEDFQELTPGSRLSAPGRQRLPIDELHGDVNAMFEGPNLVDGDDVLVFEARHRLRFAQHAYAHVLDLGTKHLDRHDALELGVVRRVDARHPPRAEVVQNRVVPDDRTAGNVPYGATFGSLASEQSIRRRLRIVGRTRVRAFRGAERAKQHGLSTTLRRPAWFP
jgi:hypothetical protein